MTQGQFGTPQYHSDAQKSALSPEQAAMADRETAELRSMPGPLPTRVPNAASYQQPLPTSMPGVAPYQQNVPMQLSDMPTQQVPVVGQEARQQTTGHGFPAAALNDPDTPPAGAIQRMLRAGMTRLQEPQPEGLLTRGLQAVRVGTGLGKAPVLALVSASGLLMISFSYYIAVLGYSYLTEESFFLAGLLTMIIPNFVRLLSRTPTRVERIVIVCFLAGCAYFVQFLTSPSHFSGFDEFLHWRTAYDILLTHHLFSFNSMLPASPYYPGLEIVTNAVSTTTGMNSFYAGNLVIALSRLLMMLALFLFYEHITGSSRMASIGSIIYAANPHFFFFDTLYNYETMALPLATLLIYILARYGNAGKNYRWVMLSAWIVLLAITITHHMTDYVTDGLLILWAVVNFFRPVARHIRIHMASIAACGVVLSLVYAFLLPGNPVWSYLSEYFGSSFVQLEQIIAGTTIARPLFTDTVHATPIWDELFMTISVALVTFSLPFGLLVLHRQHRDNALAIVFAIASLLYPLTQVFRFTSFGAEITDRAAAFLFLPIAYILTLLITHFWSTRRINRRAISLISTAIAVMLMGGVIVGSGPDLSAGPGPYLVTGDARSVEPEGIDTALWSLNYLGPDNHVATDRINQMLMSTYGHQRIITRLGDNIDVSPIFYSADFDSYDLELLHEGKIHYLAVDTRISTALPLEGTYFENDIPTTIISKAALTKFNTITQVNRLFDSGDIVIYDTGALIHATGK
ncbi:MAG TPA: hypothetical protein VL485_30790 [Ktedonobacteraceae bacterium]|jgi:hypothetical protein|nr:hypothetical protein [Ktedonobacteraceae bacterium]